VTFVASLNLTRRQLSPQALGLAGARIKHIFEEEARKNSLANLRQNQEYHNTDGVPGPHRENKTESSKLPIGEAGRSNEKAAKLVGISTATVKRASTVLNKGSEELKDAVENSKIGLQPAAKIAQMPKEQQPEALKQALAPKPKPEPKKTAKQLNEEYLKENRIIETGIYWYCGKINNISIAVEG